MSILITVLFSFISSLSLGALVYPYVDRYTDHRYSREIDVPYSPIQSCTRRLTPETRDLEPGSRNPNPESRDSKPEARSPNPESRNPRLETRNLQRYTRYLGPMPILFFILAPICIIAVLTYNPYPTLIISLLSMLYTYIYVYSVHIRNPYRVE